MIGRRLDEKEAIPHMRTGRLRIAHAAPIPLPQDSRNNR
jgi:hypothetical protein